MSLSQKKKIIGRDYSLKHIFERSHIVYKLEIVDSVFRALLIFRVLSRYVFCPGL